MKFNRLNYLLALAGTVPFIACALLPLAGIKSVPVFGALEHVVSSYGLVIACFMAGTHWGIDVSKHKSSSCLLISSNAITLLVWFAYLGAGVTVALACQIVAFITLLAIDYRLKTSKVISSDYFQLRSTVTAIVVIALVAAILTL